MSLSLLVLRSVATRRGTKPVLVDDGEIHGRGFGVLRCAHSVGGAEQMGHFFVDARGHFSAVLLQERLHRAPRLTKRARHHKAESLELPLLVTFRRHVEVMSRSRWRSFRPSAKRETVNLFTSGAFWPEFSGSFPSFLFLFFFLFFFNFFSTSFYLFFCLFFV